MAIDKDRRTRRPLVAGNWKMNGLRASLAVANEIAAGYGPDLRAKADLALCPPATLLAALSSSLIGSGLATGGQDCHASASGAFTGDVAAEMLADAGAQFVILGHSERRTLHLETSPMVQQKAAAAHRAFLTPIICIGETLSEREGGKTLSVVKKQLRGSVPESAGSAPVVIAYEPVWAIGTGRTPSTADVAEVHGVIRAELKRLIGREAAGRTRVLYGGSVKPSNAEELMAVNDVDGALVGGASLVAADFLAIARGAAAAV